MTDCEDASPNTDCTAMEELESAAMAAMEQCEANSDTSTLGAPRSAVVNTLQEEDDIEEARAKQAIVNTRADGRTFFIMGADDNDEPHIRPSVDPATKENPPGNIRDESAVNTKQSDSDSTPNMSDLNVPKEVLDPEEPDDPLDDDPNIFEEERYHLDDNDLGA